MNTVVVFSGGLDSTVLLRHVLEAGDHTLAISIDYGQRHRKELQHAQRIAHACQVEWELADLSSIAKFLAGSSQTSAEIAVPHGHYAEESMKQTVVPNRNMIMLSVAAGWAISRKFDRVAYAAHSGDHTIYPDCRPDFVESMRTSFQRCDWHVIDLYTPFLSFTKSQIVARGAELGVDFSATWSCYEGGERHCGKCGTCVERREAFALARIPDPTKYA